MKESALSTHVLDTANGIPARGMTVELWRMEPEPVRVSAAVTNADGRPDGLLLTPAGFLEGRYELRFGVGAYFAAREQGGGFLDVVALNVGLRAGQGHYHVPLLCSPWSYSTYRGS